MSSAKFDTIYGSGRDVLGPPFKDIVRFFETEIAPGARVLDLGCGQGRDALFIARLGHEVVGVDYSPVGIAQLAEDAATEGLPIEAVVADLADYIPDGAFDVVLFDRTLHILSAVSRLTVVERCAECVAPGGFLLIVDEAPNIPAIKALLEETDTLWITHHEKRGRLFLKRAEA